MNKRSALVVSLPGVFLLAAAIALGVGGVAGAAPETPGGRIVIGSIQEPETLLPYGDTLVVGMDIQNMVFDSLLNLDDRGILIPRLATEVPTEANGGISEDGRVITFRLREGVAWHDGHPFTAADVVFTWMTVSDPALPLVQRAAWEGIQNVDAPDPYTVVFTLDAPRPGLAGLHAQSPSSILPKHLLDGKDIARSDLHSRPVGTGPFMLAEWSRGSHVLLVRNPSYWDEGKPYLDEIVYQFVASSEGLRAELERGAIHLRQAMSTVDVNHAEGVAGYRVVGSPSYSSWIFSLNHRRGPLADLLVREAVELSLDKRTITETIFQGRVTPQAAAVPASHWAHNPLVGGRGFDLAQAGAKLDEAGWRLGSDGVRTKDGERLSLELLNIAGDHERLRLVQLAQAMWAEAGIEVTINLAEAASFGPSLMGGRFDLAFHFWTDQHEYDFGYFLLDLSGWQRLADPHAIDLMAVATSVDDRREAIQEFQVLVAAEIPVIPLSMRMIFDAVSEQLEGYRPNPLVGRAGNFWNVGEWYLR